MAIIALPNTMHAFRPYLSLMNGTNGSARTAPMEKAAVIKPRSAPLGLWKSEVLLSDTVISRKNGTYNHSKGLQLEVRSVPSHHTQRSFLHQELQERASCRACEGSSSCTMVLCLGLIDG